MLEGHDNKNTISQFSPSQRYPSLPSETHNQRLSDSEMLYINNKNIEKYKQNSEGLFINNTTNKQLKHDDDFIDDEKKEEI